MHNQLELLKQNFNDLVLNEVLFNTMTLNISDEEKDRQLMIHANKMSDSSLFNSQIENINCLKTINEQLVKINERCKESKLFIDMVVSPENPGQLITSVHTQEIKEERQELYINLFFAIISSLEGNYIAIDGKVDKRLTYTNSRVIIKDILNDDIYENVIKKTIGIIKAFDKEPEFKKDDFLNDKQQHFDVGKTVYDNFKSWYLKDKAKFNRLIEFSKKVDFSQTNKFCLSWLLKFIRIEEILVLSNEVIDQNFILNTIDEFNNNPNFCFDKDTFLKKSIYVDEDYYFTNMIDILNNTDDDNLNIIRKYSPWFIQEWNASDYLQVSRKYSSFSKQKNEITIKTIDSDLEVLVFDAIHNTHFKRLIKEKCSYILLISQYKSYSFIHLLFSNIPISSEESASVYTIELYNKEVMNEKEKKIYTYLEKYINDECRKDD